jgi:hypothetical protein
MKGLRLRECEVGGVMRVVVETPRVLTPWQRLKLRSWAMGHYEKRIQQARGWKRDGMRRIYGELEMDTFLERPIPKSAWEREVTLFGG